MARLVRHLLSPTFLRQLTLLCLLMAFEIPVVTKARSQDATTLEPGPAIERNLKGGETHIFRVHLTAGWFLHIVVDQKGIDVVASVLAPDGRTLTRADSPNRANGGEVVVMIADVTGDYRLEVSSPNKQDAAGRYGIRIVALREARSTDNDHVAAERAFQQARELRMQRTDASYRAAIEKYRQALSFYQSSGDRYREGLTLNIIGSTLLLANEYRKAIEALSPAVPLFQSLKDRGMEGSTLNTIGSAYEALGDLQKALGYFDQALVAARSAGNRSSEASILNNIGSIHGNQADWQKSREYYQQALLIFRDLGDQRTEAIALKNIGTAWFGLTEFEKALDFYRQALALDRTTHIKDGEADTLDSMGQLMPRREETNKPWRFLIKRWCCGKDSEIGAVRAARSIISELFTHRSANRSKRSSTYNHRYN